MHAVGFYFNKIMTQILMEMIFGKLGICAFYPISFEKYEAEMFNSFFKRCGISSESYYKDFDVIVHGDFTDKLFIHGTVSNLYKYAM
jgi:hypothetical protein